MISPTHGVTRLPNIALVEDSGVALGAGFVCQQFIADTSQTLLIGDYVYLSDLGKVSKSATVANYNARRVGIVVGGSDFIDSLAGSQVNYDPTLVGSAAASAGKNVWVAISGRAYGIANATISTLGQLIAGSTAGRLATGTTATGIIGYNITTGAAGVAMLVQIQPA